MVIFVCVELLGELAFIFEISFLAHLDQGKKYG